MAISHNHNGNERNHDQRSSEQERIPSSQQRSETQQARTSSPPRQVTIPSREPSLPSPRGNEFAHVGLATYIVEPERMSRSPPREFESIGQVQPDAGVTEQQRSTPPYSMDYPTSAPPSEAYSTANGVYNNRNSTRGVGRDVVVHQLQTLSTNNTNAMHSEENRARNGNNGDRTRQGNNRQRNSGD